MSGHLTAGSDSASTRKRKSPSAPSVSAAPSPPAPSPPPHSYSTRSNSNHTARGLSSLFSSSASSSPASTTSASVSSQSHVALSSPAAPSVDGSGALYPLADYLLHIDADELALNMDFAEQLAQHINERRHTHAHSDLSTAPPQSAAGSDMSAPPTRTPSTSSASATATSVASSSLFAPTRLPSLLSSTVERDWSVAEGLAVSGGGGVEMTVPQLTDDDYNTMLDELISNTAFAEAVVVEGPAVHRMNEEEQADEQDGEDTQREHRKAAESEANKRWRGGREERKESARDGDVDANGANESDEEDAVNMATPRTLTVIDASNRQAERALAHHSHTPQRSQPQTQPHCSATLIVLLCSIRAVLCYAMLCYAMLCCDDHIRAAYRHFHST